MLCICTLNLDNIFFQYSTDVIYSLAICLFILHTNMNSISFSEIISKHFEMYTTIWYSYFSYVWLIHQRVCDVTINCLQRLQTMYHTHRGYDYEPFDSTYCFWMNCFSYGWRRFSFHSLFVCKNNLSYF